MDRRQGTLIGFVPMLGALAMAFAVPAYAQDDLSTRRKQLAEQRASDKDGAFDIDSTLTRIFMDGRAPAGDGQLRGYIKADLNSANDGTLLAR